MAFIRWKVAVFVDGVFWHGHPDHWDPEKASSDYWRQKIARNIVRDRQADALLVEMGWRVVLVWDLDVRHRLDEFLQQVVGALREAGRPLRQG